MIYYARMEGCMLNYAEALKYLEGVSWLGIRPGLERIEELLRRLGSPERRCRYVHVAGTNGKGSTSAMLAAMLTAAGYRTGLYTSPHLLRLTERMRIDGAEISPEELAGAVAALARAAEGMAEPCTEFELITAAALWWFAERGCDYVVLEVGMGGRLDATNVIPRPDCAVVTNIGLDHTAVLGDTVEQIAAEKAGIFKGGRAVAYDEPPSVAAVLRQAAERTGTRLEFADFSKLEPVSDSLEGQRFRYGGREYGIRLLGGHQTKTPRRLSVPRGCWACRRRRSRAAWSRRCGRRASSSCRAGRTSSSTGATTPSAWRRRRRRWSAISPRGGGCCCWACLRTRTGGGCWTSCCPWRRRRCA